MINDASALLAICEAPRAITHEIPPVGVRNWPTSRPRIKAQKPHHNHGEQVRFFRRRYRSLLVNDAWHRMEKGMKRPT